MPFDTETETTQQTALVTTDKIAETVALRDAALAEFEKASALIADGYALARNADAYADRAALGFRDLDDQKARNRRETREYDTAKEISDFREQLDRAVWRALADALRLHDLMDKKEREEFDSSLFDNPPEVTEDNVRATIDRLRGDAGLIFARGLARVFSDLDPRFKSHDAFKIGSRIILSNAFSDSGYWNYHRHHDQSIIDIERVFAVLDEALPEGRDVIHSIDKDRREFGRQRSDTESRYFRIRAFKNGNAHLWFTRDDLVRRVNKTLAGYYGEVIPDAAPKGDSADKYRERSNLPAKDLQFYHTPEAVAEYLLDSLDLPSDARILEPSAGEGHLVLAIARKYRDAGITAMEIHFNRFETLSGIASLLPGRCKAINGNFLDNQLPAVFDAVIMNPPFYGTHWMDHVHAAFDLLKPGGKLRAVLPASARYNETPKHLAFRKWAEKSNAGDSWSRWRQWRDLEPESFAECGTRIQTTILEIKKPA